MAVDLIGHRGQYTLFLILLILGGHVGIPIMLLTIFLSRRVVRHVVFINFCITWVLFSLSYALLLYAGQIDNLQPPFALCLTQAAMVYASPPMAGFSSLFLILHVFLTLKLIVYRKSPPKRHMLSTVMMLLVPYITYIIVFLVLFIFGNSHPEKVYRSVFYCTIRNPVLTSIGPGISAITLLMAVGIEIRTVVMLRLHWRIFRMMGENAGLGIYFILRMATFTVLALASILVSVAFITELLGPVPNLVMASLPLAIFITFGTQMDFLREWGLLGWRDSVKSDVILRDESSGESHIPLIVKGT